MRALIWLPLYLPSTAGLAVPTACRLGRAAVSDLRKHGFVVVDGFAPASTVSALNKDIASLHTDGRFAVAGVGEASTNRVDNTVRICEQCFVYPRGKQRGFGDAGSREQLYGIVEGLREELHADGGIPLDGLLTEGLLAYYPNGGYYKRHVDAAPGTASELRAWSYLLYLNDGWQEADGGKLRIFTDGGGEEAPPGAPASFVDVSPRAGTLVLFDSSRVPHEVLETSSPRRALVGWYSRQLEGSGERRSLIAKLGAAVAVGTAVRLGQGLFKGDSGK